MSQLNNMQSAYKFKSKVKYQLKTAQPLGIKSNLRLENKAFHKIVD